MDIKTMMSIENVQISSAYIRVERGIFLTAGLFVDGDGWGQNFGGSLLVNKHHGFNEKSGWGLEYISRIMEIAGVEEWSDVKGCFIRIKRGAESEAIEAIGHIIKDDWFSPRELALKYGLGESGRNNDNA